MALETIVNNILINNILDINIFEQGIVKNNRNWNYSKVVSPFHRLYYLEKGLINIRNNQKIHTLTPGKFYFIRSNTTMDYSAQCEFELFYMHIQLPLVAGLDLFYEGDELLELSLKDKDIDDFKTLFVNSDITIYSQMMSFLYLLLPRIIEANSINPKSLLIEEDYLELQHYINAHLNVGMSVGEMARFCDQSLSGFSRKFRKVYDMSPKAYLHQLINTHGTRLLVSTSLSIKEISVVLGFKDNLYFSRFFKKMNGISPSEYRKQSKLI